MFSQACVILSTREVVCPGGWCVQGVLCPGVGLVCPRGCVHRRCPGVECPQGVFRGSGVARGVCLGDGVSRGSSREGVP